MFISPDLWTKLHMLMSGSSICYVWCGMEQSVFNDTINEGRKHLRACIYAKGGHFKHLTCYLLAS